MQSGLGRSARTDWMPTGLPSGPLRSDVSWKDKDAVLQLVLSEPGKLLIAEDMGELQDAHVMPRSFLRLSSVESTVG